MTERLIKEADLKSFCRELLPTLISSNPFVLWLIGEMGAGKTTFVREYLRMCGLAEATPVVSPTYTIVNEYYLEPDWYAHLDLYRAGDEFSFDELGLHDLKSFRGFFVEWPEQAEPPEWLIPTHRLKISYQGDQRGYEFSSLV
jgi:tRNA threonylcarbamoyl adenosine modification protein YjeE